MARCTAPVYGHRTASARATAQLAEVVIMVIVLFLLILHLILHPHTIQVVVLVVADEPKEKHVGLQPVLLILYTPAEIRTLTPVRENVEKRSDLPDLRDVFLCHAWDDRKDAAKELHDLLESKGVSVWFSEKDVLLGSSLLREIDKGLVKSRVGIVLVTPLFLKRVKGEGIADKELSALFARDLLVPIVHNTTFEDLREVSPLLGSRSGLSTIDDSMVDVASKLAELVTPETYIRLNK